jgi:phosphonate transport system permease protein
VVCHLIGGISLVCEIPLNLLTPALNAIMESTQRQLHPELKVPRISLNHRLKDLGVTSVVLAILIVSYYGAEINFGQLYEHSGNMVLYLRGFMEPDFLEWQDYLYEMLVTIQIAIWGTLLAIIFAVPFGILSSSNIAPAWVHQPVRRIMDCCRSVNEMIFAMLFIAAVGLGPFAGVLALFVHTMGILAKLFSEAVEAIDPQPVEGIRSTGANRVEEIVYGVIPQVLPLWISYTLYRFESNVRSASVLGMVGAGGIGMLLWDAIRGFQYGATAAIVIIIICTVVCLDMVSSMIRKHYI